MVANQTYREIVLSQLHRGGGGVSAMAVRRGPGGGGGLGGRGLMGGGGPVEKSLNFGPSARRLLVSSAPNSTDQRHHGLGAPASASRCWGPGCWETLPT